jgi:glutamyl-tRNA synthetase
VDIRCRFAPSPTGYLHVGSARTALFNWLFARSVGATFILRIEDTDESRNQPELVDNILDSLRWLGIDWDEGPFHQSARAERHLEAVEQLLSAGRAYLDEGAVRFKVPDDGVTAWDDVIRGHIAFENANIEDFVIRRSNGSPMFLLANAVDDLDMGVTHVVRGEDMVNNVPKQLLLMRALGVDGDLVYAHLPLLVDAQRRKLSKRFGDVAVETYRDNGFVAPAMANYLATLGWGPSDGVEIRPMTEIIERFRLEDVNRAGAFFDVKKLSHFNATYIRAMAPGEFVAAAAAHSAYPLDSLPEAYVGLIQERAHTLADVDGLVDWLFLPAVAVDPLAWDMAMADPAVATAILDDVIARYATCRWDTATLQAELAAVAERLGLKVAKAQAPVRVAVSGKTVGPPLFDSLELLGRERVLERLRAARARL